MSDLFDKVKICDKIISDGSYMLDQKQTYCEDFPDEFISEEVFQIACDAVRHLVMNNFTDVSMQHSGNEIGIHGKQISVKVSKNSIAGFCKLKNYKHTHPSSNVIKFIIDLEENGMETFRKILVGLSFHF